MLGARRARIAPGRAPEKRDVMILTSQEEFGLRCALAIARHDGTDSEEILTLGRIAESEGMTSAYAGKIMRLLVQEGLVESTRGRSGGYRLSRPAASISVAEVLRAAGSKFYDEELCSSLPSEGGLCVHNNDCSIRSLWSGIQRTIDSMLQEVSLAEMVTDEASMQANLRELRTEQAADSLGAEGR
jgi:Rrf2 family protein